MRSLHEFSKINMGFKNFKRDLGLIYDFTLERNMFSDHILRDLETFIMNFNLLTTSHNRILYLVPRVELDDPLIILSDGYVYKEVRYWPCDYRNKQSFLEWFIVNLEY